MYKSLKSFLILSGPNLNCVVKRTSLIFLSVCKQTKFKTLNQAKTGKSLRIFGSCGILKKIGDTRNKKMSFKLYVNSCTDVNKLKRSDYYNIYFQRATSFQRLQESITLFKFLGRKVPKAF